jgi:hypothetical protein
MSDTPLSSPVKNTLDTLVKGTEDERDQLLKTLSNLAPDDRAQLRDQIIALLSEDFSRGDYRLNDPQTAQTIRGWLVGALASLGPLDKESRSVLKACAKRDRSEWVRYWSLAHLYWRDAVSMPDADDPHELVRGLAEAIRAKKSKSGLARWVQRALGTSDDRQLWVSLRALQVVVDPAMAPNIASLLDRNPSETILYDVLLALTADGMQGAGAAAVAARIEPERVVRYVLQACRSAAMNKVQRFASLLRPLDRQRVISALDAELKSADKESSATIAYLLNDLGATPPAETPVPTGPWRAQFAYLAVLERPERYELLEMLDVANLREAMRAVAGDSSSASAEELLARITERVHGGTPNPLWQAWIETVHASKLQQS